MLSKSLNDRSFILFLGLGGGCVALRTGVDKLPSARLL